MATLPNTIANGDNVDASPVMANFVEIYTNITNSNVAAAADIASSKLDLASIASNVSFGNTKGIVFENSAASDDASIVENSSDNLIVNVNTVSKKLSVTDSTDAEVFKVDTSNKVCAALSGYTLEAFGGGNSNELKMYHDDSHGYITTINAGDLVLSAATDNVVAGARAVNLGDAPQEYIFPFLTATTSLNGIYETATGYTLQRCSRRLNMAKFSGGTWSIRYCIRVNGGTTGTVKLYNTTDAADVAGSETTTTQTAQIGEWKTLTITLPSTGVKEFSLYAKSSAGENFEGTAELVYTTS